VILPPCAQLLWCELYVMKSIQKKEKRKKEKEGSGEGGGIELRMTAIKSKNIPEGRRATRWK